MTAGTYNLTRDDQFNAAFSADPLYPGWKPADILPIRQAAVSGDVGHVASRYARGGAEGSAPMRAD
jgi:hypothetical protein